MLCITLFSFIIPKKIPTNTNTLNDRIYRHLDPETQSNNKLTGSWRFVLFGEIPLCPLFPWQLCTLMFFCIPAQWHQRLISSSVWSYRPVTWAFFPQEFTLKTQTEQWTDKLMQSIYYAVMPMDFRFDQNAVQKTTTEIYSYIFHLTLLYQKSFSSL